MIWTQTCRDITYRVWNQQSECPRERIWLVHDVLAVACYHAFYWSIHIGLLALTSDGHVRWPFDTAATIHISADPYIITIILTALSLLPWQLQPLWHTFPSLSLGTFCDIIWRRT